MQRKTAFNMAAACMLAGGTCWGVSALLGASVDGDGVLHEPFGLIPVGWVLLGLGAVAGFIGIIRRK